MSLEHAKTYLEEMADDFACLTSRQDQLLTLREYGDEVPPINPEWMIKENLVPGCASATYVVCEQDENGLLYFYMDSQSFISKGYLYILTESLNGLTLDEILKGIEPTIQLFAERVNARISMIASRANVFERVFRFMQKKAIETASSKERG